MDISSFRSYFLRLVDTLTSIQREIDKLANPPIYFDITVYLRDTVPNMRSKLSWDHWDENPLLDLTSNKKGEKNKLTPPQSNGVLG